MTELKTTPSPKLKTRNYRTTILVLLAVAMTINYLDRSALSVGMPFISADLHLSPTEKGAIFSSFFFGYALFNFVGGVLADRIGPKKVLNWSMILWSVMCGLVAGAFSFWSLLVLRVLFGIGEGPISTAANKVVSNWFPIKERARAVGINQAGNPVGGALSGPVVGLLAATFGWRSAFVVIALVGLTWAVIWYLAASDTPRQSRHVTPSELAAIESGIEAPPADDAATSAEKPSMWKAILRPAILASALSLFCYNYILFFFLTWFPTYLVDAQGVSLAGMSIVSALPWVAGAVGYLGGGYLIDYIYKRTGKQFFSRKVVLVTCLMISSVCVAFTGMAKDPVSAVTLMTAAVGFLMLAAPAYWTLINDAAPREYVGSAGGLMHGLSNISGIVAPSVTGAIVAASSFSGAFVLAGAFGIVGAVVVWAWVRQQHQPGKAHRV